MERALRCCLIATSVLGLLVAGGARADDRYDVARVSDQRGSLAVRGTEEDDYSYLERNSVLREGDVLWTDESGRAELELERGSWIRLAEDTKVEFRRLGKSPELRLWSGSLYADLSDRVDGVLRVKTPVGDVDVRRDSLIRVDLSGEQSARVSVHNGGAEIFADKGEAVRLGPGERLYLEADRAAGEIKRFDRSDLDGFDRYHRERVDYYLERPYPRELSDDIVGARELRDYGSWVSVDNSTYWRPNVISSWRPYSNGYWSYMAGPGMTWIDYAPWGYTTSHYGRWMYRPVYGWLWSPGFVWGPAFVSFATYGDYYGWAPLDPWGRPAFYGPGSFASVNFIFDNRSWNFCRRDHFFYSRHHRNFGGGGYNGGRYFHRAEDLVIDKSRFGLVRDANREIGVPDKRIRGPLLGKDGVAARDRVASNEQKLPGKRLELIQKRFNENPRRDLEKTRAGSGIERLQRSPGLALGKESVIKGDEAVRRNGRTADNGPGNGIGKPDVTRDRANPGGGLGRTGSTGRTGVGGPNPDRDSPFRRGDGGPKGLGPGQGGDSPFRKPDGNRDNQPNRNPVDNNRKDGQGNDDRQRAENERRQREQQDRDRQQKEQSDRDRQQREQQERQRQENDRRQREQQERDRQQRDQQERQRQERDRQERDRQDKGKKFDGPASPFDDNRYRRDGGSGGTSRGDNRSPFSTGGSAPSVPRPDSTRDNRSPFIDYGRGSQPGGSNGLAPNRGADSPFVRRDSAPSTYRDFPSSGGSRTYSPPPAPQRSGGESPFSGNRGGYSGGNNSNGSRGGYPAGPTGGYSGGSRGGYTGGGSSGGGSRGGGYSGGGNRGGGSGGSRSGGGGGGGRLPGK